MKKSISILVLWIAVTTWFLVGCGSFLTTKPTAQDVSNSQLAVQDAAIITAIQKPEWVPEIMKVSTAIVSGLNSTTISTLADVQALINQEAINMHYSPQTVAYTNLFMINLTAIVQQRGQVSMNAPV